jgi:hypothetical protein
MNRRSALKYIGLASAAAFILPSCLSVFDQKKESIVLNNLKINGDEEELLAQFADALIPSTDTPGAREVGALQFALIMVDDCMTKPDQDKYLKGLRSFDNEVKSKTGKSFMKASPSERESLLIDLEKGKDSLSDEVKMFFSTTRGYIIQGYTQSEYFLTNVKKYKINPGPFLGCATNS